MPALGQQRGRNRRPPALAHAEAARLLSLREGKAHRKGGPSRLVVRAATLYEVSWTLAWQLFAALASMKMSQVPLFVGVDARITKWRVPVPGLR